jgi:hypothetical protein
MSNSDRSKGSPIGLVRWLIVAFLCVAAIVGCLVWPFSIEAQYQREADEQTKQYAAHTRTPKYNACLLLAPVDQPDCIAKTTNEARQDQRSEQDLVAQKVSALWAFVMGAAAVIGAVLSAVGVFLVWTTFGATKAGNEINREIGRAQVRAYLTCKAVNYKTIGGCIIIEVELTNTGQSPAKAINLSGVLHLVIYHLASNRQITHEHVETERRSTRFQAIQAGGDSRDGNLVFVWYDAIGDDAPQERFFTKWNAITLEAQVEWTDVFGEIQDFPLGAVADIPFKKKVRPSEGPMAFYIKDRTARKNG